MVGLIDNWQLFYFLHIYQLSVKAVLGDQGIVRAAFNDLVLFAIQ